MAIAVGPVKNVGGLHFYLFTWSAYSDPELLNLPPNVAVLGVDFCYTNGLGTSPPVAVHLLSTGVLSIKNAQAGTSGSCVVITG